MSNNIEHLFGEKPNSENPPIWIIKSDESTFYSINASAEKEFLYPQDELFGESILKVCPSFSLNEFITTADGKLEKKIATKIRRKDGMEQAAKLEIKSFNYDNENYFHIVVNPLVSSLSGTKELKDFFYSYSFNTSPVPVIILEKSTLRIIQVNDGSIRLFGHSRDEFIGMKFSELLHREDYDHIFNIFNSLKDDKQNKFEIRQIAKSRTIDTEVFIQSIKSFDEDLLVIVVHDISEKKLALKLLENSLDNYRLIANKTTDLIIKHGLDGKINYASPACVRLLGFTPSHLILSSIYNYMHPADAERIAKGMLNMTESSYYKTRFRIKNAANNYVWLESTATLITDNKPGFAPEVISVSRDISDQVEIEYKLTEANEKVKEIERLKHIILANISHEMRTPLQSILGYSLSVKEKIDDRELSDDLSNIYENGQRLLRMINLFLNLSYMEANNFLPHFEIHNIAAIVQNAAEPFINIAKKKNILLSIASIAEALYVNTDKIILRDILDTLIDNATKFTKSGSVKILISDKEIERHDYVVISIEDSGIGIPKGQENLAMDEFRQVSEGLNRIYEGIGLGLSVAKRLVEKINGKMFINSVEGKGTTVKIYLTKEEVGQ